MKHTFLLSSLLLLSPAVAKQVITVEVSLGELFDKITILQLKKELIFDAIKQENIIRELNFLEHRVASLSFSDDTVSHLIPLIKELYETNKKMWYLEDDIRDKEAKQEFDREFIELARLVYRTNDHRCSIKTSINNLMGSLIKEEKSYKKY